MLDAGVIVPVTEPTSWINSFVIVEKTDQHGKPKMRVCLDPTPLNKAVIREPYHYQSPEDIYHHLCKAKYLTVKDFKKCYWQCLLDEESSYLTTFNTPYGWFRFWDYPLVLRCLVMQHRGKLTIYNPLPNVIGIADDIIIWGDKEDGSDHDATLACFLQVTQWKWVTHKLWQNPIQDNWSYILWREPIPPKGTNQPVTKYKLLPKCQLQPMSLNYRHS